MYFGCGTFDVPSYFPITLCKRKKYINICKCSLSFSNSFKSQRLRYGRCISFGNFPLNVHNFSYSTCMSFTVDNRVEKLCISIATNSKYLYTKNSVQRCVSAAVNSIHCLVTGPAHFILSIYTNTQSSPSILPRMFHGYVHCESVRWGMYACVWYVWN